MHEAEVPPAAPGGSETEEKHPVKTAKILVGALLAIVLVAGLYLVNRYWIAPALKSSSKPSANRPLAPDFSLTDLNGRRLTLSEHKGKVILLDFWATWCAPCIIEIPGFVKLQERYRDQGFVAIGISMDDQGELEAVREFYRNYRMNYPVAVGDGKTSELFGGILGLPTTFLIGRDGRIYAKHVGATEMAVFEEEIKELLAAEPTAEVAGFKQVGRVSAADKIEVGDPAEANPDVPGVNISTLSPEQLSRFKKDLEAMPCDCGCKMDVLKCRHDDHSCQVSRRLAREHLKAILNPPV